MKDDEYGERLLKDDPERLGYDPDRPEPSDIEPDMYGKTSPCQGCTRSPIHCRRCNLV